MAAATPLIALLHVTAPDSNFAITYLPALMLVAVLVGAAPALLAAGLAFLTYDVLFVAPYFTLAATDPQEWIDLVAFLVVAVVTS